MKIYFYKDNRDIVSPAVIIGEKERGEQIMLRTVYGIRRGHKPSKEKGSKHRPP